MGRAAAGTSAVTCEGLGSLNRCELPRTLVTRKEGMGRFLLKLADLYEPIFSSPPGRLIRASTRGLPERRREGGAAADTSSPG
jgi:hypothetical protein